MRAYAPAFAATFGIKWHELPDMPWAEWQRHREYIDKMNKR